MIELHIRDWEQPKLMISAMDGRRLGEAMLSVTLDGNPRQSGAYIVVRAAEPAGATVFVGPDRTKGFVVLWPHAGRFFVALLSEAYRQTWGSEDSQFARQLFDRATAGRLARAKRRLLRWVGLG